MTKLKIPHDAFVFVGDGRKALFLRNEGDEKFPNLKTERVFLDDNPATHDQGTDRPGRSIQRVGPTSAAAWSRPTGTTSKSIASRSMSPRRWRSWCARATSKALVVVAPPRTLADLRHAFHPDVKSRSSPRSTRT